MKQETRLTVLEKEISRIGDDLAKEGEKHEGYRTAVHTRMDKSHELYNKWKDESLTAINANARRIDHIENTVSNIDKVVDRVVDKLEAFGKEVTDAIEEMKEAISIINTRRTVASEMFTFICKLAAFAATAVAVLKYMGF